MTVARIMEVDRRTTQSGRARDGRWTLEFERQEPQRPDPLTGWAGSGVPAGLRTSTRRGRTMFTRSAGSSCVSPTIPTTRPSLASSSSFSLGIRYVTVRLKPSSTDCTARALCPIADDDKRALPAPSSCSCSCS